ncbi:MAG: SpaH/EbpB family LPXTG-anchored major pilin [Bacilli bacterium]|nr:SpaH/EbpB family LPXTG-anchored major pilin [Bacilli bacterium]
MKKILNTILVLSLLVLVPTFVVNAVSGTNSNTGTITISDAIEGKTYKAYQILKLESYDTEKSAFTYTVATGWENFFDVDKNGAGAAYVTIDAQGYVTWNSDKQSSDDMKTFAQAALAYAKANSGIAAISPTTVNGTTVKFTGLNLGYYLVDSSVGALCSLTTTKPNATAEEKNSVPTIDKEVQENSTNKWGDDNNASIGQTVEFRTTITASDGAENYVLYDKMSAGLTFNEGSIVVTFGDKTLAEGTDYTVSTTTEGYTFVITFTKSFTDTLVAGAEIVVTYDALLNKDAVIAGAGNPNETFLKYGDDTEENRTPTDTTITYTYSFDLIKTDSSNKLLAGAVFSLYDANGKVIKLVKISDTLYRVATDEDTETTTTITTIATAKIAIEGLDNGDYSLKEITAPEGYNKLASDVKFTINGSNYVSAMTGDTWTEEDGGVHVINLTGAELPTTGGMGTVLFMVIGSLMIIGAGVLLVVKLRISKMNA